MSKQNDTRKTFTFLWNIENIAGFFHQKHVSSPYFKMDSCSKTLWYLSFWTENTVGSTEIALCDKPEEGNEEKSDGSNFEFEVSLLKPDGMPLKTLKSSISQGMKCIPWMKKDELEKIFHKFYRQNDFTVRCEMWKTGEEFISSNLCKGRTSLTKEKDTVFWKIPRFSSLDRREKQSRYVELKLPEFTSVTLNILFMEKSDEIQLEFTSNQSRTEFKSFWKVSVLDIYGEHFNSQIVHWNRTLAKSSRNVPRFLTISELMAKKSSYLPNDSLILRFDCEITQRREITFDNQRSGNLVEFGRELDSTEIKQGNSFPKTLYMDFFNLYKEGLFRDFEVQVGSETFAVHKTVLMARSPVFKAMFTVDMKEKKEKCIELPDIHPDTFRNLLLFMYTDTVKDLSYDSALALYEAADKYDLIGLRRKCLSILKQKISVFNACDLLVLADMHCDDDLKKYVTCFLAKHFRDIFNSADWRNLQENHALLALETFHKISIRAGL